jgi:hypothetical protein
MEVRDEDIEFVRLALATCDPERKFAATSWFETIVEQWQAALSEAEDASERETTARMLKETAESELDDVKAERDAANEELEDVRRAEIEALEAVRLWMHDILYDLAPRGDPRVVLRKVEDALQ